MPDDPKPGGTNWIIVTLMTAQTALLSWALHRISQWEEKSENERTILLEHILDAKKTAKETKKVAEKTAEAVAELP